MSPRCSRPILSESARRRSLPALVAWIAVLLVDVSAGRLSAQEFTLSVSDLGAVHATRNERIRYSQIVWLESRGVTTSYGAQGWSISAVATGGDIVGATTEQTAAASRSDDPTGFRHQGFEQTLLTEGDGNVGVISVVVLSLERSVSLPPTGRFPVLRLALEADVPLMDCTATVVEFEDGLRGPGAAVNNRVAYGVRSIDPVRESAPVNICAAADVEVSPNDVVFGVTPIGETQTVDVEITNSGGSTLTVTLTLFESSPGTFAIDSGADTIDIPADSSVSVPVSYEPQSDDPEQAVLEIETNVPDDPMIAVPISSGDAIFLRGDANRDGAVNLADFIRILDGLFGDGGAPRCLDAADANDDGKVDVSDSVRGLGWLFSGGRALPRPGTESCGKDPSGDSLRLCPSGEACPQ